MECRLRKKIFTLILLVGFVFIVPLEADNIIVAPSGTYESIDLSRDIQAKKIFSGKGNENSKKDLYKKIKSQPEVYTPPTLYMLSDYLFSIGKKDEAAFWFYAGQLRARYDANRSTDSTSAGAVGVLNQTYGTQINRYTFQDVDGLEKIIERVIKWNERTPFSYDHRWINLHGMNAMLSALKDGKDNNPPLSKPKEKWQEILIQTQKDYYDSMKVVIGYIKSGESLKRTRYNVEGNVVYWLSPWGKKVVKQADASSFKHLGGLYGADESKVFYADEPVEEADPDTFVVYGTSFGKDKSFVFVDEQRCSTCDLETFRQIGENFYADNNHVYQGHFRILEEADAGSFREINNWFQKDKDTVFHLGSVLEGADAATFRTGNCGVCETCAEDTNQCYWFNHPTPCDCKPHTGADFPGAIVQLMDGTALVDKPIALGVEFENPDAFHGISAGYWRVDPGLQKIPLSCWIPGTKDNAVSSISVKLEEGKFYKITNVLKGSECVGNLSRPSLIRGSSTGVILYFKVAKKGVFNNERTSMESQVVVESGPIDMEVTCRKVTRKKLYETQARLKMNIESGLIYQLRGTFDLQKSKCEIMAEPIR